MKVPVLEQGKFTVFVLFPCFYDHGRTNIHSNRTILFQPWKHNSTLFESHTKLSHHYTTIYFKFKTSQGCSFDFFKYKLILHFCLKILNMGARIFSRAFSCLVFKSIARVNQQPMGNTQ